MVVLASKSVARRKLIKKCIHNAIFKASNIDETQKDNENVREYIARISFLKALKAFRSDAIIIGADTVIYFNGEIIGKPKNEKEAFDIIKMLSGKVHEVYTGVSIINKERCISFIETAKVKLETINDDFIVNYIKTGEFKGKAGGYAIQGRARSFVKLVEGDFTTVVGLPIKRLCKDMIKFYNFKRTPNFSKLNY